MMVFQVVAIALIILSIFGVLVSLIPVAWSIAERWDK